MADTELTPRLCWFWINAEMGELPKCDIGRFPHLVAGMKTDGGGDRNVI